MKDIWITFNSQHLTEGVAVRVLAHFLERDAERLYTSYTVRGLLAGQLHDDVSWVGLVNPFLKRYLNDDVLGEAYDAVATARQQSHETESKFEDRLETAVFRCTAVFPEQSLAHYFVWGLAPATCATVSEIVQRLPSHQMTDLPTIRRISTAEGTTYRARSGLPLPDSKPAGGAGRTTKSTAITSLPASALHIREDERQADAVLITQGAGPMGGRPPSTMSTGTTSRYATALAATPRGARGTDPRVAELDISNRDTGGEAPRVPSSPMRRRGTQGTSPRRMASRTCAGYAVTYGHAMYACPFLSPEQRMFTAYRNYRYQMETRPRVRNLLRQAVDEGRHPRQGLPNRSGGGARFAPRGGGYRSTELDRRDPSDYRQADTRYPPQGGEGTETVLGYPNRHRTPSCTCKIGQRISTLYLQRITRENRFSPSLRSCDVRSSQLKVKMYPSTSPMTHGRSGGIVPPHAAKDPRETWPPIARRLAPIARVVRKKGKDGYAHAVA